MGKKRFNFSVISPRGKKEEFSLNVDERDLVLKESKNESLVFEIGKVFGRFIVSWPAFFLSVFLIIVGLVFLFNKVFSEKREFQSVAKEPAVVAQTTVSQSEGVVRVDTRTHEETVIVKPEEKIDIDSKKQEEVMVAKLDVKEEAAVSEEVATLSVEEEIAKVVAVPIAQEEVIVGEVSVAPVEEEAVKKELPDKISLSCRVDVNGYVTCGKESIVEYLGIDSRLVKVVMTEEYMGSKFYISGGTEVAIMDKQGFASRQAEGGWKFARIGELYLVVDGRRWRTSSSFTIPLEKEWNLGTINFKKESLPEFLFLSCGINEEIVTCTSRGVDDNDIDDIELGESDEIKVKKGWRDAEFRFYDLHVKALGVEWESTKVFERDLTEGNLGVVRFKRIE